MKETLVVLAFVGLVAYFLVDEISDAFGGKETAEEKRKRIEEEKAFAKTASVAGAAGAAAGASFGSLGSTTPPVRVRDVAWSDARGGGTSSDPEMVGPLNEDGSY